MISVVQIPSGERVKIRSLHRTRAAAIRAMHARHGHNPECDYGVVSTSHRVGDVVDEDTMLEIGPTTASPEWMHAA